MKWNIKWNHVKCSTRWNELGKLMWNLVFWGKKKQKHTHTHTQPLSVESPFQANCNFRDCHGMTPLMEAAVANYGEAWDLGRTHPAVSRCFSGHLQTKAVEKMLGEESTVVGEKAMGVKIPRLFSELFLFPWVYIYLVFGLYLLRPRGSYIDDLEMSRSISLVWVCS